MWTLWPLSPSKPIWSLDTPWSWKAPLSWNFDGKWRRTLVAWQPTKTCSTEKLCNDKDQKHKSTYLVTSKWLVYFVKVQNLPGGPVFPFGPAGPLSPFTPATPGTPISPCSPFTPVRGKKAYHTDSSWWSYCQAEWACRQVHSEFIHMVLLVCHDASCPVLRAHQGKIPIGFVYKVNKVHSAKTSIN